LLSRIMARESNLLVLDEPTNDLDVETLDLLQELLAEFDGTVLLVSHDRDFIDRVATSVIASAGDGAWVEYAGGWSDHLAQKAGAQAGAQAAPVASAPARSAAPKPGAPAKKTPARKLSYAQTRRLELLPDEMAALEREITLLERKLADANFYARDPRAFAKATDALAERRTSLERAENEWLTLESAREAAEG